MDGTMAITPQVLAESSLSSQQLDANERSACLNGEVDGDVNALPDVSV